MKHADDIEIAANLRVVISRLVKIMRKEIKQDQALSLTERSTLTLIYQHQEILPSELALMEKVSNQSMSQIINKLFNFHFIKKTASKKDKRKVIISIAPAGKKFVEQKRAANQEWLAKALLEKTSKKEKKLLVNAIIILTKLVDLN